MPTGGSGWRSVGSSPKPECARDLAKGEAAAESLALEGLNVRAVRLDVTSSDTVVALVRDLAGSVDVLVNNAGVDYDTDQSALTADLIRCAKYLKPTCSAPGLPPKHSRLACKNAAGAASST